MNRRAILCGSTAMLSGLTAGCLDDWNTGSSGDEAAAGDDDGATTDEDGDDRASIEPETVCETVDAILEAVVAEEYDVAASFAPTAYVEELEADDVRREYEALDVPEEALERSCEAVGSGEEFLDAVEAEIGDEVAVGDGNEIEIDLDGHDATIEGFGVELDGDWYGAIDLDDDSTGAEARAAVEIDVDDEEFTVAVVALGDADYVTLGGVAAAFDADEYGPNDADDLSGVELEVGHVVTVDGTDLTGGDVDGSITAIAVDEANDVRTQVASQDVEIAARS